MQALYDVPAPAKLNLFLHVVGKRDDGYHLLQSLFVLIDWADTLHFERRSDGQIHRHDLGASGEPLPADDLCVRAARALQAATGCTLGADIQLDKRLPSGAGMGGGSSDAASTLLALNRLWGLGLKRAQLAEIGLRLGADVPFFIGGRNAFVEGIGERLTPLNLGAELRLAVLKPQASIATKEIFSSKLLQRSKSVAIVAGFPAHNSSDAKNSDEAVDARSEKQVESLAVIDADLDECLQSERLEQVSIEQMLNGFGRNDLQKPAEAVSTEVVQALALLQERFGNSRMTGSGSAVFAQACKKTGSDASFMATMLEDLPPGWTGRMCRSLQAHPLVDWAED